MIELTDQARRIAQLVFERVPEQPGLSFVAAEVRLLCVVVAGVYGGITAKFSILYMQALPAAVALVASWLAHRSTRDLV